MDSIFHEHRSKHGLREGERSRGGGESGSGGKAIPQTADQLHKPMEGQKEGFVLLAVINREAVNRETNYALVTLFPVSRPQPLK